MKKLFCLLGALLFVAGCGFKPVIHEASPIQEKIVVYGAFKAEYAGKINYTEEERCDSVTFKKHARVKEGMDKVVDIVMEESCSGVTCSCAYSGIGLKYKPMDLNEAMRWESAMSNIGVNESAKNTNPAAEPVVDHSYAAPMPSANFAP